MALVPVWQAGCSLPVPPRPPRPPPGVIDQVQPLGITAQLDFGFLEP
jgi:hypothetical protein